MDYQTITAQVRGERADALEAFVRQMELGMQAHDVDRGPASWRGDDAWELFNHLREEVEEVNELLERGDGFPDPSAFQQALRREAADVANLAFMLADAAQALLYTDTEGVHRVTPAQ